MKDLQDYLRQEYEQAIDKHGLSLAPDDFLESLDFEEVAYYVFEDSSMSDYVKTIAEDYFDPNRTMKRIEDKLRDITEDELADVRSDIADIESYARDPFGHYGISKSNFYGVT